MRLLISATAVLATVSLSACSSQQLYGAGQGWQRLECNKINDAAERSRCMASTSGSYEDYKRQSDAVKSAK
ncbi:MULTISPECIES: hypothetical protein [Oxalobacteraceae]|jgi:hypothetical protein|uniref:hypothetical protein n=1 Tax=Oxalobacteraceae TaxID=75682 RepID=UPI0010A2E0D6|nr:MULTISPECIES: hypothetical protein [Oxalobacteraceae]HJV80324.1 hypothetical protein [Noviherbaspirillum sp.]